MQLDKRPRQAGLRQFLANARGSRYRVGYGVATAVVIGECIAGGLADVARQAPFYPVMIQLGYPPYFSDILGVAKLLAAAALLTPGVPRLKEWAYAGIMFNMIGAVASHLAVGDGIGDAVVPAAFAVTTLLSWGLRPRLVQEQATSGP